MNEDTLNMEIRKYLKTVGIKSQREIEYGVLNAIKGGGLTGTETLQVKMTLSVPSLGIEHQIDGEIALQ
jgi:uncharacterized protein DUF6494